MKERFYGFFDDVGEFITSMAIVLILMVPFMGYRFFEFKTLFKIWLPIKDAVSKEIASSLISGVFVTFTLLFMVNVKRLFKGVTVVMALTAFILNIFFWSLIADQNWWFILFISAVIASIDYGQAHLFDRMWYERGLKTEVTDLEKKAESAQKTLTETEERLRVLEGSMREYEEILEACTCKQCKRVFSSPQAVNAHKCNVI